MREVFTQRTKVTPSEDHGMPAGVPKKSKQTIQGHSPALNCPPECLEIRQAFLQLHLSLKATQRSLFPRAVKANSRLSLSITQQASNYYFEETFTEGLKQCRSMSLHSGIFSHGEMWSPTHITDRRRTGHRKGNMIKKNAKSPWHKVFRWIAMGI